MHNGNRTSAVHSYLLDLQDRICAAVEAEDGAENFREDAWERPGGGGGRSRVLAEGAVFEQAGINFSHVFGPRAPCLRPPLTVRSWPAAASRPWASPSSSIPRNPYVPTTHMNVRFFIAEKEGEEPVWWFGGGFDLTPYYGFEEDAVHWHRVARDGLRALRTRTSTRASRSGATSTSSSATAASRAASAASSSTISTSGDSSAASHLLRSVGDHFLSAYLPILRRRRDTPYGERERDFQLYRRGRYVEFNLV